jgi:hypothetical protein
MKKYFSCLLIPFLLSCEADDHVQTSSDAVVALIVILLVVFVGYMIVNTHDSNEKYHVELKKNNIVMYDYKELGDYVGGHPNIDDMIKNIRVHKEDDQLVFYENELYQVPKLINNSAIKIENIDNVTIEDASSIENKITLGRVFLVGIFALAWKKKKKNELAFVVIQWHTGKFQNETTFSFEGTDAVSKANKSRNQIIKMCTNEE